MKIKSLYLVNLVDIIKKVEKSVLEFSVETGIDVVNDLTNLLTPVIKYLEHLEISHGKSNRIY